MGHGHLLCTLSIPLAPAEFWCVVQLSSELLLHGVALGCLPGYTKRPQLCANEYPQHAYIHHCQILVVRGSVLHKLCSEAWLIPDAYLICILLKMWHLINQKEPETLISKLLLTSFCIPALLHPTFPHKSRHLLFC